MIILTVQFTECPVIKAGDPQQKILGTVNHSMFYVSDSKPNTMHRVHCTLGANSQYFIEKKPKKYNAPREYVGDGFEIKLTETESVVGMTGEGLAQWLAKLSPPPVGKGGCQWWTSANVARLEECGYAAPGTLLELLADKRMDSYRLMEFEDLRDILQTDLLTVPPADLRIHYLSIALKSAQISDEIDFQM